MCNNESIYIKVVSENIYVLIVLQIKQIFEKSLYYKCKDVWGVNMPRKKNHCIVVHSRLFFSMH